MKTKTDIATYIVLGLLTAGALFGVIYGVVTHDEPTVYDSGRWDRDAFPLKVQASTYTSEGNRDARRDENVADVIRTVNARLGFDAYEWADGEAADIVIIIGVPFDDTWVDPGGNFELSGSSHQYTHCDVQTSNTGTDEMLWLTLYHELGHCLGLVHDDYELSIMRPTQTPTPSLTIPPWISDQDRAKLRELYRPR